MDLMEHQKEAIKQLGNGKILYGNVGTGKSLTALGYYMEKERPRDIYVITTAKKRDTLDWQGAAAKFGIGMEHQPSLAGSIIVDSWNNIGKYMGVVDGFFIFDEQRLVGNGSWVKSFLVIAKANHWILLTATPGDTWMDYVPVFIANGWYKNVTEFKRTHCVYAPYVKFPVIMMYLQTKRLELYRNDILVEMPYIKHTQRILNYLDCGYNKELWDMATKRRWHPYDDRPIMDIGELFRVLRKIDNTDPSRLEMVKTLMKCHPRLIIFYNFNYELEILRTLSSEIEVAEWNGHRKQPVPDGDKWVYLVQYTAGSEGWNCTATDAMVQYSLTYSYKNFVQSQGRIDRIDTPFEKLYYYILVSTSPVSKAVKDALVKKENFNERNYMISMLKPANNLAAPGP